MDKVVRRKYFSNGFFIILFLSVLTTVLNASLTVGEGYQESYKRTFLQLSSGTDTPPPQYITAKLSADSPQAQKKKRMKAKESDSIWQREKGDISWESLKMTGSRIKAFYMSIKERPEQFWGFVFQQLAPLALAWQFSILLLAGLGGFIFCRRARDFEVQTRELLQEILPGTLYQKLLVSFHRLTFDILPILVFVGWNFFALYILPMEPSLAQSIRIIILAYASYIIIGNILKHVFNPEMSQARLIPFQDFIARHFYRSLKRLVGYSAFFISLLAISRIYHFPAGVISLLRVVFSLGLLFLIFNIIKKELLLNLFPEPKKWLGHLLRIFLVNGYPLLVSFMISLFAIYSLGYTRLFQFILQATGASMILVGLAFLLDHLAKNLLSWLMKRAKEKKIPEEERFISLESFQNFLGKIDIILRIGIILTVLSLVLNIWGVEVELLGYLFSVATKPLFKLGETSLSILSFLEVLGFFALAAYLAKYIRRFLEVRIYPKTKLDPGIQHATSRVFGYIIIALGIYIGLETVGIDLSALTIFAGVVGIGVGFGLQNIANNFISGLIILVERPIKKGDFIEIGNVLGTVTEIRARSTIIRTRDNIDMIVPNSDFLSQIVVNWSHGNPITRLHVPIGVAYGSDTQRVKEVLSQIAANHHNVLRIPEPKVWFKGFGESSLDFELLAWTDKPDQIFTLKSDLNFAIDSAFRENHITIPFPQRDLHLRTSIPLETITSSPGNLLEKICDEPRT